ncbi:MAG: heme ABC exporter ATP-binding protein CcmA [Marmoricola sp.]
MSETTAAIALSAQDVSVRYGEVQALHEVSLRLEAGRFLAVTGPSGAGKTTLLWALAGALRPDSGTVTWDGRAVPERAEAAREGIVLVPQGNGLARTLTAAENVQVALVGTGTDVTEARTRTEEALTLVGLEESANHLIEELSGGQQQRVAIARALAARARVILADEPTSDLDAGNRGRVVAALRAEAARGAVVVMATHDPEAAISADAELRLDAGRMVWVRDLG